MKHRLTGNARHVFKRTIFGKQICVLQVEYEFEVHPPSVYMNTIYATKWRDVTPNDLKAVLMFWPSVIRFIFTGKYFDHPWR